MQMEKKTARPVLFRVGKRRNASLFRDAAEAWIASLGPEVKESTVNKYANMLALYVDPVLGDRETESVDRAAVQELCARLLRTGGAAGTGLSPKTVAGVVSVIRRVLRFAGSGAARELDRIKTFPRETGRRELRVLSVREQRQLYTYLINNPCPAHTGILISLFTGLRLGEVCALDWADISLEEGTLWVHRTMQRIQDRTAGDRRTRVVITEPKSPCSRRVIPLPRPLERVLSASPGEGFVLTNCSERFMEPRTLENRFKAALRRSGVADANFHALRHTFATRCVERGCDIKSLSEILGHSTVGITMDRYVHPSLEMKRRNICLLDGLMDGD